MALAVPLWWCWWLCQLTNAVTHWQGGIFMAEGVVDQQAINGIMLVDIILQLSHA